jgi:predicted Zn-dependent protease
MIPSLSRRVVSILVLGLGASFFSPQALGYALEGVSWPGGTVITMQMELGPLNQTLQDGSPSWNEAVAPAIDAWNAQMQRVQLAKVLDSTLPISSGDGVNSASFASTVFGDSFGSGVLAVTYYRTQGATLTEADVLFNKAQTFDSYRGNLQFNSQGKCVCDIQRIFLHELGHALGLNHPDGAGQTVAAIMNSVVSNLYQLTADDEAGIQFLYGAPTPTPTPSPSATPAIPSRLVNISTRVLVGVGDDVLIGGFIIQGNQLKKVILRAIGPSLTADGVTGALQDPQIELHDSTGALLDSNDNWQDSLDAGEIIASTIAPSDPREAAIVARLAPGNYTVIISGVNNTSGIGLVEAYTLDTSASHAANISTRGRVGAGEDALIGGFIVGGNTPKKIIVRALGPSLGTSNSVGVLANPLVELHDSTGQLLAMNDDWNSGSQASEIIASGIPPTNPLESALIATLAPGNYTAVVRGADGGAGLALVEIYDLDP